jgi:endoribonuclease Dicer
VIKEFRTGEINVLVATAIVEEGLDIPKCNLVFRFNKPPNFSSYMQSKGRARAKQNASYVLLLDDESDGKTLGKDLAEYRSYDEIEQVSFIMCTPFDMTNLLLSVMLDASERIFY